jgi:hypothetical protein
MHQGKHNPSELQRSVCLMLFEKRTAVCSENCIKYANKLCWLKADLRNIRVAGACSKYWALKAKRISLMILFLMIEIYETGKINISRISVLHNLYVYNVGAVVVSAQA